MKTIDPGAILSAMPTFRLYSLASVRAAHGMRPHDPDGDGYEIEPEAPETEQGARIGTILARGEAGCWRRLAHPTLDVIEAVSGLGTLAPHMAEAIGLVLRHVRGRFAMSLPTVLPATLLLGPPGVGKSWFAARLAAALGVPHRSYAMSSSTLSEGLSGSHGSWKNANAGLVARTLLQEGFANPLFFIDEFDKAYSHGWNGDPYRPFYQLLEPEGARAFVDEFLCFPIDARYAFMIMTANSVDGIPAPIIDRLTIIEVPEPDEAQLAAVAASLYREANDAHAAFFEPEPRPDLLAALADGHPRKARKMLCDAMMRAAADGRRAVRPSDRATSAPPRPVGPDASAFDGTNRRGLQF